MQDMTCGSPAKLMLRFALPLLVGNVFQQLYNFADAIIVGQTMGYRALAAVGETGPVFFLVFGFYFGLTGGLAVITGQRFGARDPEGVRKSVAASAVICAAITLFTTAVCVRLTPDILRWMNTPQEIWDDAYDYMIITFYGTWSIVLYGMVSSLLRALGDSLTPLIFLVVSCLLNIVLDLAFILGCGWGVAGAAHATVAAQAISGFICLGYSLIRYPMLRLHWCNWNVCRAFYGEHLRVALPMALQFSITAVGSVILQSALNAFGAVHIAAVTVASKLDSLGIQPMFSFGMAMAAFTAQNYGARALERIRRGVWICSLQAVSFAVLAGIAIIVFTRPLALLFMNEVNPDVLRYTQVFININCALYAVLAMLLVYRNVLQGMGRTFWPLMAGVAELAVRTTAALVLVQCWGFVGVCWAHPLAWISATAVLFGDYLFAMHRLKRDGIPDKDHLVRRNEGKARTAGR